MCDKSQSNYSIEDVNFKFILRFFIGNPIMTSVERILNIKDNVIVSLGSLMKMFVCLSMKICVHPTTINPSVNKVEKGPNYPELPPSLPPFLPPRPVCEGGRSLL